MNALKTFALVALLVALLTSVQSTYAYDDAHAVLPESDSVTNPLPAPNPLGLPDFVVTSAWTQPVTNNGYFTFTVKNIKPGGNGWSTVAIHRNGYPQPLLLSVPPLNNVGDSHTRKVFIGCNVKFSIVADYYNQYQEWSETNNTLGPLTLPCNLPD